jgi:hypothetical protein
MGCYPTHLTHLHGLPVHVFPVVEEEGHTPLPAPGSVAWKLTTEGEFPFDSLWRRFLDQVRTDQVTALVLGAWWDEWDENGIDPVLELLTAAAPRFPRLRAVFLGDVVSEESEISWIMQGEVTRVLRAWPGLRELGVRGADGLVIEPLRHDGLHTLRIESGGLPPDPVRALAACDFKALRHLDLWLGTTRYGGDCTRKDIAPLLTTPAGCPELRHLGLRNSDIQDDIAAALAGAPVVAGLESLDLSMGVLSDDGGAALLAGRPLTHLRSLDLRHHFMGDELVERFRETLEPHGVSLALTPARRRSHLRDGPEARYVAVGE